MASRMKVWIRPGWSWMACVRVAQFAFRVFGCKKLTIPRWLAEFNHRGTQYRMTHGSPAASVGGWRKLNGGN